MGGGLVCFFFRGGGGVCALAFASHTASRADVSRIPTQPAAAAIRAGHGVSRLAPPPAKHVSPPHPDGSRAATRVLAAARVRGGRGGGKEGRDPPPSPPPPARARLPPSSGSASTPRPLLRQTLPGRSGLVWAGGGGRPAAPPRAAAGGSSREQPYHCRRRRGSRPSLRRPPCCCCRCRGRAPPQGCRRGAARVSRDRGAARRRPNTPGKAPGLRGILRHAPPSARPPRSRPALRPRLGRAGIPRAGAAPRGRALNFGRRGFAGPDPAPDGSESLRCAALRCAPSPATATARSARVRRRLRGKNSPGLPCLRPARDQGEPAGGPAGGARAANGRRGAARGEPMRGRGRGLGAAVP